MLIQNIGKRCFILAIDNEPTKVEAGAIIDATDDLAKDLLENYNGEWVKVELPKQVNRQTEEKIVESRTDKKKK